MATTGLTIFFAVIVAVSALLGLIRGLNKSVVRLMTLAVAVILTFVIAAPVTSLVAGSILLEGMTLGELLLESVGSTEMAGALLEAMPLLREAILVLPAFAMAFVIFPVLFLVLRFISWVVFLFVQKPLRRLIFKDNCNKEEAAQAPAGVRVGKRFAGMGVGIVAGVLIFGMLTAPVLGLFSVLPEVDTVEKTLDALAEQDVLGPADVESLQMAYAVTGSPVVKFYDLVGISAAGRAYINSVSRIKAEGDTVKLAEELGTLLSVAQTAVEGGLLEALLAEDPDAIFVLLTDKEFTDPVMQELFRSRLLCAAVPEVMAIAVESAARGLNVPENKEAVYNDMMEDIALAVKNAGVDYAAVKAYEDVYGSIAMYARTSVPAEEVEVMTEAEYEAEIQKLVKLATAISTILNNALSGENTTFTDSVALQIIEEVKTDAAENGQESIENYDGSSVQAAISDIDSANVDAGDGDAEALLEQLADQAKFETDTATVESIKESIRESVKAALADEATAAQTAGTLTNVVTGLAQAISAATNEDGSIDAAKLDFEKIAGAVTELQNSTLKEVGTSVLDIVAAGDLGSNSMAADVIGALKEGYENGEDIGGAINTAGALISLGSAMNGESQEAMVDSLSGLIGNLNEYTLSLLPSILSPDTIAGMGIPAEYAESTYGVIETLLKELVKLQGAEDYTNEVNSILALYELATTGTEGVSGDNINDLVGYAVESDVIYNTLMSVSASDPFGLEIQDKQARKELVSLIEDGYAQSGQTQREKDIYNAVAMLLGLDDQVDLG